jgi:hypothetical protein
MKPIPSRVGGFNNSIRIAIRGTVPFYLILFVEDNKGILPDSVSNQKADQRE